MGNKISKSRTNKEGDPESLSEKFREAFSHHIKVKNDKDVLPPPPYHEEQVAKPAATEEVAGNNNSTTNDAVDATTGNTAKEENKEKHECPRYSVCTGGNVTLHCSDDKTVIITGSGLYCINGRFYGLLTFWSDEKAVKDIYLIDKVYETSAIITRMKFLVEGKSLDPPDSYDDPVEEHKVIQVVMQFATTLQDHEMVSACIKSKKAREYTDKKNARIGGMHSNVNSIIDQWKSVLPDKWQKALQKGMNESVELHNQDYRWVHVASVFAKELA